MLVTRNPTANQSPDATLGGLAVTTPTNTGHASTATSVGVAAVETKSCRWHTWQSAPSGVITKITLKFDHTSQGVLSGAGASNTFEAQYSLNGGGAWITAVSRLDFTISQGPTTFSVDLPNNQDISQVQVRVLYNADTTGGGTAASVTATIANIKLEVLTHDVVVSGGM